MRTTHVCDERIVGLNYLHQRLDVARVRRAHLHDRDVVCGVQAQQCLRHADVVVEVALGVEHVVFLQQHRSREFLCGSLAVGSGDADDRRAERTAVIACELLQSVQTVVDENEASVALNDVLRFIDNSISAALLKRSRSKLVAVERSAFQGEEQRTDGAVATVGCNNGVLLKDFVKFGYFHFCFYFCRQACLAQPNLSLESVSLSSKVYFYFLRVCFSFLRRFTLLPQSFTSLVPVRRASPSRSPSRRAAVWGLPCPPTSLQSACR